ncbi:MAG: mechanosensitive ion channel domain-containing protein [Rubripirellula sp.]
MSSASNAAIRVSRPSSEFVGHQECWGRCSLCVTVQRPAAWLRWMRALAGLVFCLAFMAQQVGPASAVENELMTGISSPGENSATPAPVAADFEGIQEECRLRIKSLRDEMLVARANQKVVRPQATKELELWGSLEIIVEEWRLAYEDRLRHESGQPINSGSVAQAHQPPGSFLEVDELRARRVAVISSLKSLHLEVASEQRIANGLSDDFDSMEQEKRKTAEALSSSGVERRFALQQQLVVQALESRVLKANLDLHNERIHLLQTHAKDAASEVETLDALVNAPSSHFKLSKQELDERLTILDKFEQQLRMQLSALDTQMREIMMRRHAGKNISESNYDIVREESQLLRDLLSNTSLFKECWRRRYELSNFDVPPSEIEEWLEDGEQLSQQVAQIDEKLRLRTRQRRESLSLLTRAAGTVTGVTGGSVSLTGAQPDADTLARIEELENVLDFYGGIQVLATSGGRLCSLFLEDLRAEQDAYSFADNAELFWGWVLAAWEFEITESEGKAITVKKVVIGLALLLFGYLLSRALASLVAYRVLPRFGVSHAAASVLRSVMLYAMIVALFFVSLDVVNVPLTFFAFFGGAAAIGLGFGSQNLLNNFISGLILLVERPIRVGDLVNVDGIDANVEHIGARSTRVRTGSNLEILVPNSKFLENNVTNWTLSDTRIRTSVSVGVAYGSPVAEVIERLKQVIREQDKVLLTPEPIVLFQDFGDSSLAFEVHFWVQMKRIMDGAKVRSSVRAAIDEDFRKAGIVIAFPQRDVHIDMSSPLEVRLKKEKNESLTSEKVGDSSIISGVHRLRRVA